MPSTIAKTMCPPSSGRNGSRLSSAIESEISPSTQRKLSVPCLAASDEPWTMPTGLEMSLRPSPVTRLPSDVDDVLRDLAVTRADSLRRGRRGEPGALEDESEPVDAVDLLRRARAERDSCAVAEDDDRQRLPVRRPDRGRRSVAPVIGAPLIETILSPDWRPDRRGGSLLGADVVDAWSSSRRPRS